VTALATGNSETGQPSDQPRTVQVLPWDAAKELLGAAVGKLFEKLVEKGVDAGWEFISNSISGGGECKILPTRDLAQIACTELTSHSNSWTAISLENHLNVPLTFIESVDWIGTPGLRKFPETIRACEVFVLDRLGRSTYGAASFSIGASGNVLIVGWVNPTQGVYYNKAFVKIVTKATYDEVKLAGFKDPVDSGTYESTSTLENYVASAKTTSGNRIFVANAIHDTRGQFVAWPDAYFQLWKLSATHREDL